MKNILPQYLPDYKNRIDYFFWIFILFVTNTGGIIDSLGLNIRIINTYSIFLIYILFLHVSNLKGFQIVFRDKTFKRVCQILIFWFLLYYILWFIVLNDGYTVISLKERLIKTRFFYTNWLLVIPSYYFIAYRGVNLWMSIFLKAAIIYTLLFLASLLLGIDILSFNKFSRGYIDVDRIYTSGSEYLQLGLHTMVTLFILPKKYYSKNRILLNYGVMAILLTYILALTRRYFIYIIAAFIIGELLSRYLFKKQILLNTRLISVIIIFSISMTIVLPRYYEGIIQGVATVFATDKEAFGTTKKRMELGGQKATGIIFLKNPWLGSGYMNEWYSSDFKKVKTNYGVEGGDYIFISSAAMFGIVGLILFFPFYYLLYGVILKTIKLIKTNKKLFLENKAFSNLIIVFLSLSIFFFVHLISYPMWFNFIGPGTTDFLYIYAGILLGCARHIRLLVDESKFKPYIEVKNIST